MPPTEPSAEPSDTNPTAGEAADDRSPGISAEQANKSQAGWVALLALVLAVAGAGLSAYTWYATHVAGQFQIGRELGRLDGVGREVDRLVESYSQIDVNIDTVRRQAEENRRDVLEKIDSAGATLRAQVQALAEEQASARARQQDELESLASVLARTRAQMGTARDDWLLQEVAHLLLLANQRLALTGDLALVQKALALADERLKTLADPKILEIRRALAQEQAQLTQLDSVDVAGISLTLVSLVGSVGEMPLKGDGDRPQWQLPRDTAQLGMTAVPAGGSETESESKNGVRALGRKVLADLGDLVRVRRVDETRIPKLDVSERFLAYENLRLQLVGAQLALLRRDEDVYRETLRQARTWLGSYFEAGDPLQSFDIRLVELQQIQISLDLPDISGSLALLRAEIQRRDSAQ